MRRLHSLVRLIALLAMMHSSSAAEYGAAESPQSEKRRPRVKIAISEETTGITGPLSDDGYVDYAQALDQSVKQGVTAENNAVVPLVIAFGKQGVPEGVREEYRQRIGLAAVPQQTNSFVRLPRWWNAEELHQHLSAATHSPWGRSQYPHVAKWIASNERPLRLVMQASQRATFYSPLIVSALDTDLGKINPGLIGASDLPVSLYTQVVHALLARALLQLNDGHPDDCWKDLLAAHRLTRLVGRHPTVIGAFLSLSVESEVCVAERTFLLRADLSPQQLRRIAADLDSLPPLPVVAEKYDRAQRWAYLDSISRIARGGHTTLKILNDISQLPPERVPGSGIIYVAYQPNHPERSLADVGLDYVDWNYVLREGNRWYDRVVAALEEPAGPARTQAVNALADEHQRIRGLAFPEPGNSLVAQGRDLLEGTVAACLQQPFLSMYALSYRPHTRRYLTRLYSHVCRAILMRAFWQAMELEDATTTQFRLTRLTAALALYRNKHGRYPPSLSKLSGVPLLETLVVDLYSGEQLRYESTSRQFELISVGKNGRRDTDGGSDDLGVSSNQEP